MSNFPELQAPLPFVELSHKIIFTKSELHFLRWVYHETIGSERQFKQRPLEVITVALLIKRHLPRILSLEKCKLKMTVAEVLALKRIITSTPLPAYWLNEGHSLTWKLDEVTASLR